MIEECRDLVAIGVAVHLLHPKSKRPVGDDWQNRPVMSYAALKRRYRKGQNVGIRLGEPSQIDREFLHAIDLDIRDESQASDAWDMLQRLFPSIDFDELPMVQSGSGGASRHLFLTTDEPFRSKVIAKSKGFDFVYDEEQDKKVKRYHWQIEFFGTGKQVACPPSVHPSGGRYKWLREFPIDGPLPHIDVEEIEEVVGEREYEDIERDTSPVEGVTFEDCEEALEWLIDRRDDYESWRDVGMAVRHQFGEDGWPMFDEWSKGGAGYKRRENRTLWRSFKQDHRNPITFRTILQWANEARHEASMEDAVELFEDEIDIDEFEDLPPVETPKRGGRLPGVPDHLLSIPGELQHLVDYYNETARKPQPQFAVQAALAFGSVVLGRHWCTDQENYSSLYFLNLAPTAGGKEYAKHVIERTLEESGLGDLIGPKKYTSDAGLMSALLMRPRHISISDEFGRYLSSDRQSGDSNRQDAQSGLLEVTGRLNGTHREKGYSTHGMSKEQAEAVKNRKVERPAVTILGLSTPETFFEAISIADVRSGFLNRILVVNSRVGRQKSRVVRLKKPPKRIIEWAKDHAWANSEDDDMADVRMQIEPTWAPEPVVVPFSDDAMAVIDKMEDEVLAEMDRMEPYGMADLFGRTVEMAHRIALIVAVSDCSQRVRAKHMKWARDYVFHYHREMAEECMKSLGKTEKQMIAEDVFQIIRSCGAEGATEREIVRRSRPYQNLDPRERDDILSRVRRDFGVAFKKVEKKESGWRKAGRPRQAYVAPKSSR